jgi:hypothetical protein
MLAEQTIASIHPMHRPLQPELPTKAPVQNASPLPTMPIVDITRQSQQILRCYGLKLLMVELRLQKRRSSARAIR